MSADEDSPWKKSLDEYRHITFLTKPCTKPEVFAAIKEIFAKPHNITPSVSSPLDQAPPSTKHSCLANLTLSPFQVMMLKIHKRAYKEKNKESNNMARPKITN
jgi:hypothetical protein